MYTDQNRNKDKFMGFSKGPTRNLFKQASLALGAAFWVRFTQILGFVAGLWI